MRRVLISVVRRDIGIPKEFGDNNIWGWCNGGRKGGVLGGGDHHGPSYLEGTKEV